MARKTKAPEKLPPPPKARLFKPDPIFPALDAYKAARATLSEALSIPETRRNKKRRTTAIGTAHHTSSLAERRLGRTKPRTMDGVLQLLAFLDECREGSERRQFPFDECFDLIARAHGGLRKLMNG